MTTTTTTTTLTAEAVLKMFRLPCAVLASVPDDRRSAEFADCLPIDAMPRPLRTGDVVIGTPLDRGSGFVMKCYDETADAATFGVDAVVLHTGITVHQF